MKRARGRLWRREGACECLDFRGFKSSPRAAVLFCGLKGPLCNWSPQKAQGRARRKGGGRGGCRRPRLFPQCQRHRCVNDNACVR